MEKPSSRADLVKENTELKAENAELRRELKWLKDQLKLSRKSLFGSSSEKSAYDLIQLSLFPDDEAPTALIASGCKLSVVKGHTRKTRLITDKLPPDLPIETIEYDLEPGERICPKCAGILHRIGKETVREELKIIPAQVTLRKHVRNTYGCRRCERNAETPTIIKAGVPEPVIKGGFASPEAVAHIMTQKFVMGSPLYRLEKEFGHNGVFLSRQTMSNWLIKCSEDWLEPIYNILHANLIANEVLMADETVLHVLNEPGRAAQSKGYLWIYRTGGDAEYPIVISEYQPGRHGIHAANFLEGFSGFIHCDGYAGYNKLPDSVIRVGCWAHARRLYDKALKILPIKEREGTNAFKGKRYCDELFDLERDIAGLSAEVRYLKRMEKARPILDKYRSWLLSFHSLGDTLFGRAVRYSLEQWEHLTAYLLDGRLELSNNRTERTARQFVIPRKNFLFTNTLRGAKASAVIFSIVQTALESNLNPYEYLAYIFHHAPNMGLKENPEKAEGLLPQAISMKVKAINQHECG